ncbi:MAG: GTPase HflX [Candidatus Cloacimonetes bacterium]|nr:GTPase HflX [Candidatus Cloacimonadota bacterium]
MKTESPRTRVFIAGIWRKGISSESFGNSFDELNELAKTAGVKVKGRYFQQLEKPVAATFLGKGKIDEIARNAREQQVSTLIFNDDLTPSQARNIANLTHCNVVDRTELILDIFAKHARTHQAKLQVELAQLEYAYSRLKNKWKHLSRIQGGIGFRGPGEKQIETDRREINYRITILKKKLIEIRQTAEIKRKKRDSIINISLVGYTNSGKSTLFNLLARDNRYTANQLFATLDSKTRKVVLPDEQDFVISDTIGFIENIPHHLIESFNSTLLDVRSADLLLHVVDITNPRLSEQMASVNAVLEDLNINQKNILLVFNKVDLVQGIGFSFLKKQLRAEYPDSVFISALTGEELEQLQSHLSYFIQELYGLKHLIIPDILTELLQYVRKSGVIFIEEYDEKNKQHKLDVKLSDSIYNNVVSQIEKYHLLHYINS